jgi:hypothetical protein
MKCFENLNATQYWIETNYIEMMKKKHGFSGDVILMLRKSCKMDYKLGGLWRSFF